jgi:hypothetical protein
MRAQRRRLHRRGRASYALRVLMALEKHRWCSELTGAEE